MKNINTIVFILVLSSFVYTKSYENYKVIRVSVTNQNELNHMKHMVETHEDLHFWNDKFDVPGFLDIQASPIAFRIVSNILNKHSMSFEIIHNNLQEDINELLRLNHQIQQSDSDFFDSYATFDQMQQFLVDLQSQYPDMSKLVNIGSTIEGRAITGIVISNGNQTKPKIVINGCQHAREWISPMTVAYIAQYLCENYTKSDLVKNVVDAFEWTVIPIVNGDGYVYTWTNNRLWRKNRRQNEGSDCYGVDINRNWDFQWDTDGSSQLKCSDTYAGTSGFSEPEETAVANYIGKYDDVVGYIDYHAYGALFMYPWGYVCDQPTPDAATQNTGAEIYAQAVKSVNNLSFTTGPICDTIYPASGDSADWTYGDGNVVYSYACELRGNSFILPPEEIIPSGNENFAGIIAWATYINSQM